MFNLIIASVMALGIALSTFSVMAQYGGYGMSPAPAQEAPKRVINMLAVEYKGTFGPDEGPKAGQTVNAYRWDPSTIIVKRGEAVELKIFGVNGKEHIFYLEGHDVKGVLKRGETVTVSFTAGKPGVYKLICTIHQPHMVAEVVVLR